MREYFLTIPLEEQDAIWAQVAPDIERREAYIKRVAKKKSLELTEKKKGHKL